MSTSDQSTRSMDVHQPPLNTSQLGVMQSASTFLGLTWSDAELFVGSGHAFVTNVRLDLCPSGPYVWKTDGIRRLFNNLNLNIEMIGFVLPEKSSDEERKRFDEVVLSAFNAGKVCTIECLDHQVVKGYDDEGFLLTQPWSPTLDATPPKLKFGSFDDFSNGPPICASAVSRTSDDKQSNQNILREAVTYGIDLWDNPTAHVEEEAYGMGALAYTNWIKAIDDGFGQQHGAWWNGTVWSECKWMAARYFNELSNNDEYPSKLSSELASNYQAAAEAMMDASKLDQTPDYQKNAVRQAEAAETRAVGQLRELLPLLS